MREFEFTESRHCRPQLRGPPAWEGGRRRAFDTGRARGAPPRVASIGDVSGLLATEAVIGIAYTLVGYAVLRFMELESRRRASLQVA